MKLIIISIIVVVTTSDYVSGAILKTKPLVVLKRSFENSKLPVVPNASQCGGSGQLSEFRAQGCAVNNDICTIPTGEYLQLEIDYVPEKDAKSLNLKVVAWVEDGGPEVVYNDLIMTSKVSAGTKYTIQISYTVDPSVVSGKKVKAKWHLNDKEQDSLRLCVEAEALFE